MSDVEGFAAQLPLSIRDAAIERLTESQVIIKRLLDEGCQPMLHATAPVNHEDLPPLDAATWMHFSADTSNGEFCTFSIRGEFGRLDHGVARIDYEFARYILAQRELLAHLICATPGADNWF